MTRWPHWGNDMSDIIKLVPKTAGADNERDVTELAEVLENLLVEVKAGRVDYVAFVALHSDGSSEVAAECTIPMSAMMVAGGIRQLDGWHTRMVEEDSIIVGDS